MDGKGSGGIRSGRARSRLNKPDNGGRRGRARAFSESVLFVFGLVFVIVYFTGLLYSAGNDGQIYGDGSVAVMASADDGIPDREENEGRGVWDLLEDCLRDVLADGAGETD